MDRRDFGGRRLAELDESDPRVVCHQLGFGQRWLDRRRPIHIERHCPQRGCSKREKRSQGDLRVRLLQWQTPHRRRREIEE